MPTFSKFTAAAVQAAPCFMDVQKTLKKVGMLVAKAALNGAELVVFPEVFVPGYPYWNWLMNPLDGGAWFEQLYMNSINVPGPEVQELCRLARQHGIFIAIGVNERGAKSVGTIYNTNLLVSPTKGLINQQRKLVPTFAEKLSWTSADAVGLRVSETELGPMGMLACGENTNTLARYALLAEGELIHIANFVAFPFGSNHYDMPAAIKLRIGAHSFEGKVFSIVSCSAMSEEILSTLARTDEERERMSGSPNAFSGIFDPWGQLISEPLVDVEGITYAEIDLKKCIAPKQYQDIIGHYNRFDVFSLTVNRHPQPPIRYNEEAGTHSRATISQEPETYEGDEATAQ